jgi:hypothetical protein
MPMLHVYLHNSESKGNRRSRRYVPVQLEYYQSLLRAKRTVDWIAGGVVVWEYSLSNVMQWTSLGPFTVRHVRANLQAPAGTPSAIAGDVCMSVRVHACFSNAVVCAATAVLPPQH